MKIIVHTSYSAQNIQANLGRAEYSYYFVLAGYLPALQQLGEVVSVADPLAEVDTIFEACQAAGETCVFLCFAPPHLVPITLRCPTIPVFAWEFSTIPCETWSDDPRSDWRVVFAHCKRVITLSSHTAALVKAAMGEDFPVFAIPAASFDAFADVGAAPAISEERALLLHGYLFDSAVDPRFTGPPPWPPTMGPFFGPLPPEPAPPPPEPMPAEPEPELEPEFMLTPEAEPEPEFLAPPRAGARQRISITAYYLRRWYHDVLRDILPRPLTRLGSFAGRSAYRVYRLASPLPVIATPEPATELPAPVVELPEPAIELPEAEAELLEPVVELPEPVIELPEPEPLPPPSPPPAPLLPECHITLRGVVYVSVFAPQDGRKNWQDMLSGFVWTFRDNPNATLFLKIPVQGGLEAYAVMYGILNRFGPFQCRVIYFAGFLDDTQYRDLIRAATYYVNSSHGEGLCLPLMEFLSAGRPAVAPDYTAMADYIDAPHAFVLRGSLEHNVWPFDPRDLFTTMRYRLDWESLVTAFEQSYDVAMTDGSRYAAMGAAAVEAMRAFCAVDVVRTKLAEAMAFPDTAAVLTETGMVTA